MKKVKRTSATLRALHTERERTSKLRYDLDAAQGQLADVNTMLKTVVAQRDRIEQDVAEYGDALDKVLTTMRVLVLGANEVATQARTRAYERMRDAVIGKPDTMQAVEQTKLES
jgi:hypothetical protein